MNPFKSSQEKKDLHVFNYYDSVSETYSMPVYALNKGELIRQLVQLFQNPEQRNAQIVTHPEDFTVFQVGYYNRLTGELEPLKAHTKVITMLEIKSQADNETMRKENESKLRYQAMLQQNPDYKPTLVET